MDAPASLRLAKTVWPRIEAGPIHDKTVWPRIEAGASTQEDEAPPETPAEETVAFHLPTCGVRRPDTPPAPGVPAAATGPAEGPARAEAPDH